MRRSKERKRAKEKTRGVREKRPRNNQLDNASMNNEAAAYGSFVQNIYVKKLRHSKIVSPDLVPRHHHLEPNSFRENRGAEPNGGGNHDEGSPVHGPNLSLF